MRSLLFSVIWSFALAVPVAGAQDLGHDPLPPIAPKTMNECNAFSQEWVDRITFLLKREESCHQQVWESCRESSCKGETNPQWDTGDRRFSLYYRCQGHRDATRAAQTNSTAQVNACRQQVPRATPLPGSQPGTSGGMCLYPDGNYRPCAASSPPSPIYVPPAPAFPTPGSAAGPPAAAPSPGSTRTAPTPAPGPVVVPFAALGGATSDLTSACGPAPTPGDGRSTAAITAWANCVAKAVTALIDPDAIDTRNMPAPQPRGTLAVPAPGTFVPPTFGGAVPPGGRYPTMPTPGARPGGVAALPEAPAASETVRRLPFEPYVMPRSSPDQFYKRVTGELRWSPSGAAFAIQVTDVERAWFTTDQCVYLDVTFQVTLETGVVNAGSTKTFPLTTVTVQALEGTADVLVPANLNGIGVPLDARVTGVAARRCR